MQQLLDNALLIKYIEHNIFKLFNKNISWNVSNPSFIKHILAATYKLAYAHDKMSICAYVSAPIIKHRNSEEDYDFWIYMYNASFWQKIAIDVERCLAWPDDFSKKWAIHMSKWLYSFIDPLKSPLFLEYYSRDEVEIAETIADNEIDPYLNDYY